MFNPRGDSFHIWDNQRDNHLVAAWFNYAGVNDKWKPIKSPDDGGQRTTVRNLDERFSQICFVVVTHNNQSPIVRFTTRPRRLALARPIGSAGPRDRRPEATAGPGRSTA